MKSRLYSTTGNDQLSGWTEKKVQNTSKDKLARKKIMVVIWWHAACLIHYSFLNLFKTITSEKYTELLILLVMPAVLLFTLSALFAEPRVGKRLKEDTISRRNCRHVYSLLAGTAAITQPLSWLVQQSKQ